MRVNNGTEEATPDVQEIAQPMPPPPPAGDRPAGQRALKVHDHHWVSNDVTLLLHPLPDVNEVSHHSIDEIMRLMNDLTMPPRHAGFFVVYTSSWDPSWRDHPCVTLRTFEKCIREANLLAGYFIWSKLCGNHVPETDRDLPDPEGEEHLDGNPLRKFLYESRTSQLADRKQYRAWATMANLRICDGCCGAPGEL